jgi:hypothetical protein
MEEETLEWEFDQAGEVIPVIEDFVVALMKWAEAKAF